MAEYITQLITALSAYVEPAVVALIILCGIIAKRLRPKDSKVGMRWATFIIAAAITIAWAKVQTGAGEFTAKEVPKYLFSYILANALYDWLVKYLIDQMNSWIKKASKNLSKNDE